MQIGRMTTIANIVRSDLRMDQYSLLVNKMMDQMIRNESLLLEFRKSDPVRYLLSSVFCCVRLCRWKIQELLCQNTLPLKTVSDPDQLPMKLKIPGGNPWMKNIGEALKRVFHEEIF